MPSLELTITVENEVIVTDVSLDIKNEVIVTNETENEMNCIEAISKKSQRTDQVVAICRQLSKIVKQNT